MMLFFAFAFAPWCFDDMPCRFRQLDIYFAPWAAADYWLLPPLPAADDADAMPFSWSILIIIDAAFAFAIIYILFSYLLRLMMFDYYYYYYYAAIIAIFDDSHLLIIFIDAAASMPLFSRLMFSFIFDMIIFFRFSSMPPPLMPFRCLMLSRFRHAAGFHGCRFSPLISLSFLDISSSLPIFFIFIFAMLLSFAIYYCWCRW